MEQARIVVGVDENELGPGASDKFASIYEVGNDPIRYHTAGYDYRTTNMKTTTVWVGGMESTSKDSIFDFLTEYGKAKEIGNPTVYFVMNTPLIWFWVGEELPPAFNGEYFSIKHVFTADEWKAGLSKYENNT